MINSEVIKLQKWEFKTAGIPDDYFIRDQVPMTKEEVRSVVISKLRLKEDQIAYDIGAGSGSISVEMGLIVNRGQIYAVEKKKKAVNLIKKNIEKFKLKNICLFEAEAAATISQLPAADRVFIGGSGGNLKLIIKEVDQKLKDSGRIVLTAVTINTLIVSISELEALGYQPEIINLSISRTKEIKTHKMFKALNPVYIISAEKKAENYL